MHSINFLDIARHVFEIEARSVSQLSKKLTSSFSEAVEKILDSNGRVIVCGMGKSGIIGKKIAATFASTGTPSFFMHPGEAYHGDLGMVTPDDVFIAISNSGETEEVIKLIPFLTSNKNYLIAITGCATSSLARAAHSHLNVAVEEEACPLQLAPTSSTTAALAMGDALAVTLMTARDFKPVNFARFHPGGSLGRRLLRKVKDEMKTKDLPYVTETSNLLEVINAITKGGLGLTLVDHSSGVGLITDGDVRRGLEKHTNNSLNLQAVDLMATSPHTVHQDTRIEDAFLLMDKLNVTSLLVAENDCIIGIFKK